jgi:hypothetical protein
MMANGHYGRLQKPGPKKHIAIKPGPACEKCRRLQIGPKGGVSCGAMHGVMSADGCPDYKDASVDRGYVTAGPAWRLGLA